MRKHCRRNRYDSDCDGCQRNRGRHSGGTPGRAGAGWDLRISIDRNIQEYATQLAEQACATKEADSVYIIAMDPRNGEILAMVNYPEFDLNDPYALPELTEWKEDGSIAVVDPSTLTAEQKQEKLNAMWRNGCINDTYEPGSTFKIITAAAGLEAGVVTPEAHFPAQDLSSWMTAGSAAIRSPDMAQRHLCSVCRIVAIRH